MKLSRKIGILISVQMGLIMGATFTTISMIQNKKVIAIGIVISALISAIISGIIGGIIPMKDISEKTAHILKIDTVKNKILYNLIEAVIGAAIFTPILCSFFVLKNVGIHNPHLLQIWMSTLLTDFLVGIPLNCIFCPLFKMTTGKIFGVSSIQ